MDRAKKILRHIKPDSQIGLEIGPLDKPMVTRTMGTIRYVDHATTKQLKEKCLPWGTIDVSKIVEIDYVWGKKDLKELTQSDLPFDYVIASHVIEHVPDFIGWLKEIRSVLKIGGILSLAIPDKRFTYDYFRQLTTTSEIIEAYLQKRKAPSLRQIFDYHINFVRRNGDFSWRVNGLINELINEHSMQKAWVVTHDAYNNNEYVDVHCWVFTEISFFKLLEEITRLELFDFKVKEFFKRDGHEFYVTLEVIDQNLGFQERLKIQLDSMNAVLKQLSNPFNKMLFDYTTWKVVHLLRLIKRKVYQTHFLRKAKKI